MVEAMEIKAGFKQTEVGAIPNDWIPSTVDELIRFEGGSQPPLSTFSHFQKAGYIRLLQIRDYKTDRYLTYIPEKLARKKCTTTDIMIGRYGPPIFQILKGLEGAYNVALIKAIPCEELIPDYTLQFLKQKSLFYFI
jgi:type I restriction enzyme S subunit